VMRDCITVFCFQAALAKEGSLKPRRHKYPPYERI